MPKMYGIAAGVFLMTGGQALAHTHLASSSPAEGGVLAADAKELTFIFDGLMKEATCNAADASGKAVAVLGQAQVDREKVHVPVTGKFAAGAYAMTCHYKGVDGHEMNATVKFTVAN
ncbi:MAG: copper resistance protein CopC [Rhodospirillaceae bacterium]|nr:copper resistance protein CopC [Rhodospirillaceae bacterium]